MSDKFRRIGAWIGIAVLFGIYLVTLISAILQKESTGGLFIASLYCTFVVPVWIFVLQAVYNRTHKDAVGKAKIKKLAEETGEKAVSEMQDQEVKKEENVMSKVPEPETEEAEQKTK